MTGSLDAITVQIDLMTKAYERLAVERDELRDLLAGVWWMLDQGYFVRSIEHDGEGDYSMRSVRLVLFLKRIDAALARCKR